ncbi:erythromycin esterase family protein [Marinobacter caseinilyticus]|uniref:erythromycin esterase family protein n=1 Tax=Marinobacter caseinilyticus TaxID=2692195 RepID=UPI0014094776|nr:erythromycin esterase family protein [Marinobacter caseinilyticus]
MCAASSNTTSIKGLGAACIKFDDLEHLSETGLLERIGDARLVMIGEASHGTSEFYEVRAAISRLLIEREHFQFIAIEGDWPDAARVDHYVRHKEYPPSEWTAFARFPTWMWRNQEVRRFVDWLRAWNSDHRAASRVAFYGLDLYSLYTSMYEVLTYLQQYDSDAAEEALRHYRCLLPYRDDPVGYARAALSPAFKSCEQAILKHLNTLHESQKELARHNGERVFDLWQNAQLVASAEAYYRTMFFSGHNGWNLRDTHMFSTLARLLEHWGADSRGIVWAHNSHVGDSEATDMSRRGEYNIGRLAQAQYGDNLFTIGFGTHTGTVAAASDWGGPMATKRVRPSLPGSYERLFHDTGLRNVLLPLRDGDPDLMYELGLKRLQRAIGVIYRPETERQSHYYDASLPAQFDEYIWLDETRAVTPLHTHLLAGLPDTYPFGL